MNNGTKVQSTRLFSDTFFHSLLTSLPLGLIHPISQTVFLLLHLIQSNDLFLFDLYTVYPISCSCMFLLVAHLVDAVTPPSPPTPASRLSQA